MQLPGRKEKGTSNPNFRLGTRGEEPAWKKRGKGKPTSMARKEKYRGVRFYYDFLSNATSARNISTTNKGETFEHQIEELEEDGAAQPVPYIGLLVWERMEFMPVENR